MRAIPLVLALAAVVLLGGAALVTAQGSERPHKRYTPLIARASDPVPTPTATPRPTPFVGAITAVHVPGIGVNGQHPIEEGDTHLEGSREFFDNPSGPSPIMWYPRFGRPGFAAGNTILAAHVDYVNFGPGPFARILEATPGGAVYITMANGQSYAYTIRSVALVPLSELDMDAVVFPALDSYTERVTLISCGGTFIPSIQSYDARIILVAERAVD